MLLRIGKFFCENLKAKPKLKNMKSQEYLSKFSEKSLFQGLKISVQRVRLYANFYLTYIKN